jgi:4-amino-4-deoxy-L-arabinose transferase-like glycosyltransferase
LKEYVWALHAASRCDFEDAIARLRRSPSQPWATLALVVATAVLYLHGLGASPLLEPDEGRYASIAREMLARGDWVVPRLDGLVYAQKPPLGYWLTALAYRLLGVGEAGARLAPALAAVATVAVATSFGARVLGPGAGLAAGAMLATMPLFYLFGRLGILDMPLTLFLTLALVLLSRAADDGRLRWQLGAGLALGGALLVKGLVGLVLPLAVVGAAALVERDGRALGRALLPAALAVLLALPWLAAAAARVPGFAAELVVRHHLERYAVGGKIGHAHVPGYLVPVLLAGALPWSLVLGATLAREGAAAWRDPARRVERWLDLWLLVVLGFFSASRLQIATYVCPAFVPLALRAGAAWAEGRAPRWPLVAWAALATLALALVATPQAAYRPLVERLLYERWWTQAQALRATLLPAAAAVAGGTAAALAVGRRGLALALAAAALGVGLAAAEGARGAFPAYRALGGIARARHAEADRLVVYGRFLQGLPFYARRRTVVVGPPGPLDFGARRPEGRALLWTERRLRREWDGRRRLFLVIRPKDWRALRPRLGRPASVLALEHDRVLLANAPLGARPPRY